MNLDQSIPPFVVPSEGSTSAFLLIVLTLMVALVVAVRGAPFFLDLIGDGADLQAHMAYLEEVDRLRERGRSCEDLDDDFYQF